mmetsp:Transcript_58128/g.123438  ORF Transcript_58128/g.123438 Transcript_58128/m.123438 type:complete len:102 (-) Transcript_58128:62-367(-)
MDGHKRRRRETCAASAKYFTGGRAYARANGDFLPAALKGPDPGGGGGEGGNLEGDRERERQAMTRRLGSLSEKVGTPWAGNWGWMGGAPRCAKRQRKKEQE